MELGDTPVAADYDGDGKADVSVFRPESGGWYRLSSRTNEVAAVSFGVNTDLPIPAALLP